MAGRPAARPCLTEGCPNLVRQGRCPQHQRAHERRRPKKGERGYGPGWGTRSARLIAEQPWCSRCLHPGSEGNPLTVDHIVSLAAGGASTDENLQVLCRRCNSSKGAR